MAELVREQLLAVTRDEVPHRIACRVTEWDWPHIRCEILVERDSQKGIVIGRGGAVLKEVGTRVRDPAPAGGLPRAVRQGGQGLAEPPEGAGAARLLSGRVESRSQCSTSGPDRGQELVDLGPVAGAAHGGQGLRTRSQR